MALNLILNFFLVKFYGWVTNPTSVKKLIYKVLPMKHFYNLKVLKKPHFFKTFVFRCNKYRVFKSYTLDTIQFHINIAIERIGLLYYNYHPVIFLNCQKYKLKV